MSTTTDIRAYINPQPALSEVEQKRLIEPFSPIETYVETRNEKREDWIESLRPGSVALLPELFVLAKAEGRKDARLSDLLLAKDEIYGTGAHILEASGLRSNDRAQWRQMLAAAKERLAGAAKAGKVGKKPFGYTPEELRTLRAIMDSRNFANWNERVDAMIAAGVKPPGRSWCYTVLPKLTEALLRIAEPAKVPKRRPSLVYFIQDGNRVKIGHSANPKARMKSLRTHRDLVLLATTSGGQKREGELHRKFAAFKIKGTREWFRLVPEIAKYIAVCKRRKSR